MAELGALSLKISADGGAAVVAALKQIDTEAKKTAAGATPLASYFQKGARAASAGAQEAAAAQKALNKEIADGTRLFALQARAVDVTSDVAVAELRASAAAQQEWLRQIKASTVAQAQFNTAVQIFERRVATARAAQTQQTAAVTVFGRELTATSGKLSAFSSRAITGFNAAAFALSSLASGGQVGFRTLAQAASSFAAFFGTGGAIASIGITAGLAIFDWFTRTKRQIEELAQKAIEEAKKTFDSLEALRKSGDVEGLIEQFRVTERDDTVPKRKELVDATNAVTAAEERLAEVVRQRNAFEIGAAEEALKNAKARESRASLAVDLAEAQLATIRGLIARAEQRVFTKAIPIKVTAVEAQSAADAEKDRLKRIEETVGSLANLSKANRLTGEDLQRLAFLEEVLNTELERGNLTRERRALIEQQLGTLREAGRLVASTQLSGGFPAAVRIDPARIRQQLGSAGTLDAVRDANAALIEQARIDEAISDALATALVNGIAGGFARGLAQGGIGEGFKQLGASLLQGFGSVFMDVGATALKGALQLEAITTFLSTLNPVAAIAAATALIAFGSALGGRKGGTRGGVGGGFAGGFASSSSPSVEVRRLITDPNAGLRDRVAIGSGMRAAPQPEPVHITVIGADSGRGQEIIGTAAGHFVDRGGRIGGR